MKIIAAGKKDARLKKKFTKEWHKIDLLHYGRDVIFKKIPFLFIAVDDKDPRGYIEGYVLEGVGKVSELIVEEKYRGRGIGKKLMKKTEDFCRQKGCFKIILTTGKNWEERRFYKKLGYKTIAYLPNHWANQDFVILEKYL